MILGNKQEIGLAVSQQIIDKILACLGNYDSLLISLCGGTSVRETYVRLGEMSTQLTQEQWDRVTFCLTDERVLESEDSELNGILVQESLIRTALSYARKLHFVTPDMTKPVEMMSEEYEALLKTKGTHIISILSSGEDGHIASLYPEYPQLLEEEQAYVVVRNSPKPPATRITMTLPWLNEAEMKFLYFIDDKKAVIYEHYKEQDDIPAQRIENPIVVTNLE